MKKQWALMAVLLAASCGPTDARTVASSMEPSPTSVLRIICGENGTRVLSSQVRARQDGAHFRFINRAGMDEFWMRSVENADVNHGGFLRKRRESHAASHEPGRMWVACFERGDHPPFYEHDGRYAEFEIVDPNSLWIPTQVVCDDPETIEREPIKNVQSADAAERWLRENYDIPSQSVRERPGYPRTEWKGDPWVLVHDGITVANFHVFKERPDEAWRLSAEICN